MRFSIPWYLHGFPLQKGHDLLVTCVLTALHRRELGIFPTHRRDPAMPAL